MTGRVLTVREVEDWRVWIAAHGGRELPSIVASHEALRALVEDSDG